MVPLFPATLGALLLPRCRALVGSRVALRNAVGSGQRLSPLSLGGRGLQQAGAGDAPPPPAAASHPATWRQLPALVRSSCVRSYRPIAEARARGVRTPAQMFTSRLGPASPRPTRPGALAPRKAGGIAPLLTPSWVRILRPGGRQGRAAMGSRLPAILQMLAVAKGPPFAMSGCSWDLKLWVCPNFGQTHPPT